jgi:hypothetical protein
MFMMVIAVSRCVVRAVEALLRFGGRAIAVLPQVCKMAQTELNRKH